MHLRNNSANSPDVRKNIPTYKPEVPLCMTRDPRHPVMVIRPMTPNSVPEDTQNQRLLH